MSFFRIPLLFTAVMVLGTLAVIGLAEAGWFVADYTGNRILGLLTFVVPQGLAGGIAIEVLRRRETAKETKQA